MARHRGVSLVEVLVATVLLGVGVSGCVAALLGAARLRLDSSAREAVAATAEERLGWFEARGCDSGDTTIAQAGRVEEHWVVRRDSTAAALQGHAVRRAAGRTIRLSLTVRRECR